MDEIIDAIESRVSQLKRALNHERDVKDAQLRAAKGSNDDNNNNIVNNNDRGNEGNGDDITPKSEPSCGDRDPDSLWDSEESEYSAFRGAADLDAAAADDAGSELCEEELELIVIDDDGDDILGAVSSRAAPSTSPSENYVPSKLDHWLCQSSTPARPPGPSRGIHASPEDIKPSKLISDGRVRGPTHRLSDVKLINQFSLNAPTPSTLTSAHSRWRRSDGGNIRPSELQGSNSDRAGFNEGEDRGPSYRPNSDDVDDASTPPKATSARHNTCRLKPPDESLKVEFPQPRPFLSRKIDLPHESSARPKSSFFRTPGSTVSSGRSGVRIVDVEGPSTFYLTKSEVKYPLDDEASFSISLEDSLGMEPPRGDQTRGDQTPRDSPRGDHIRGHQSRSDFPAPNAEDSILVSPFGVEPPTRKRLFAQRSSELAPPMNRYRSKNRISATASTIPPRTADPPTPSPARPCRTARPRRTPRLASQVESYRCAPSRSTSRKRGRPKKSPLTGYKYFMRQASDLTPGTKMEAWRRLTKRQRVKFSNLARFSGDDE